MTSRNSVRKRQLVLKEQDDEEPPKKKQKIIEEEEEKKNNVEAEKKKDNTDKKDKKNESTNNSKKEKIATNPKRSGTVNLYQLAIEKPNLSINEFIAEIKCKINWDAQEPADISKQFLLVKKLWKGYDDYQGVVRSKKINIDMKINKLMQNMNKVIKNTDLLSNQLKYMENNHDILSAGIDKIIESNNEIKTQLVNDNLTQ
jgi:hypothetical protein